MKNNQRFLEKIKKLNVCDVIPWDHQQVNNPTKMEYFVDSNGMTQKKVYESPKQSEVKIDEEKEELRKLFEIKKAMLTSSLTIDEDFQKPADPVKLPIVEEAEKLLERARVCF